jgi:hypothetical protein
LKLPILKLRLIPDGRCIACGQGGYVIEKAELCMGCMNRSFLQFERRRKALTNGIALPKIAEQSKAAGA